MSRGTKQATQTEGFWVVLMRNFTVEHAQFLFSATEWHSRGGETKYYQLNGIPRQRSHFLVCITSIGFSAHRARVFSEFLAEKLKLNHLIWTSTRTNHVPPYRI